MYGILSSNDMMNPLNNQSNNQNLNQVSLKIDNYLATNDTQSRI